MSYRIRETGEYVATFSALKSRFPGSLRVTQSKLTVDMLNKIGVDTVLQGPQATGGTVYQYSQFNGLEQVGDQWFTKYILGPIFTDTTDEDGVTTTAAEHQAEYEARKDAEQANNVRAQRDRLLAECDWVTVKAVDQNAQDSLGIQVPQVWLTYRQALRDITTHEDFPNLADDDWPVEPE